MVSSNPISSRSATTVLTGVSATGRAQLAAIPLCTRPRLLGTRPISRMEIGIYPAATVARSRRRNHPWSRRRLASFVFDAPDGGRVDMLGVSSTEAKLRSAKRCSATMRKSSSHPFCFPGLSAAGRAPVLAAERCVLGAAFGNYFVIVPSTCPAGQSQPGSGANRRDRFGCSVVQANPGRNGKAIGRFRKYFLTATRACLRAGSGITVQFC